jgi:hypothetical protein
MKFMKVFFLYLLTLLNKFEGQEGKKIIPDPVKQDLWVWKKWISDSRNEFPIGKFFKNPPVLPLPPFRKELGKKRSRKPH